MAAGYSSSMKPILAFLALLLSFGRTAAAPDSGPTGDDRGAVVKVVQQFFDALRDKDGAALTATCTAGAQFTSGRPATDGYAVKSRPVEADAARIAASKDAWLERMWSPTVHLDGRIAVVWTRYDFHLNGKMSHNGLDCFTLIKTDQGWKIVCGAYTVEPGTKTENPAGPPK